MQLRTCQRCCKQFSETAANCPHCGQQTTPEEPAEVTKTQPPDATLIGLTVAGIVVWGAAIGMLVNYRGNTKQHSVSPRRVVENSAGESTRRTKSTGDYSQSIQTAALRESAQRDRESFYNPDRKPPYLANLTSGHTTRSGAIAALAIQFEENTSWVERNMEGSNSMTQIHNRLWRAKFRDAGVQW